MTKNKKLLAWVKEVEELCEPDRVYWCDGSEEENQRLLDEMVASGAAVKLNPEKRPGCYLFRSDPSDVARVEDRTFIASKTKEDAGPPTNGSTTRRLKKTMTALYKGCMHGRTLYVIRSPWVPSARLSQDSAFEITDTVRRCQHADHDRMGTKVLETLGDGEFVPCLHSSARAGKGRKGRSVALRSHRKEVHQPLPEERLIWSYGSGYGGNALLGKKCFALRIASVQARDEGGLAEHMLILRLTDPEGNKTYITGAFPSACGKTNLAMLIPTIPGWKVETIGDDIAWMKYGKDGRLYAINPIRLLRRGPGTSDSSNFNAMRSTDKNSIFTNVALTNDGDVWWEGIGTDAPAHLIDWKGKDWRPGSENPAAHPNARFTAPASQCPCIAPEWQDPAGVPISAILIGGRRPRTIPLCMRASTGRTAFSWAPSWVWKSPPPPSPTRSSRFAATLSRCCRLLATTYAITCSTARRWRKDHPVKLPKIFYVNWFAKAQTASSSGRASARTAACSSGS
jgi:phosphoenolpyruvate carboxykinase (GTP)